MLRLVRTFTILTIVLGLSPFAKAACHVVTPAGSGTKSGADWNNALAGLPGSLTRGDTYYLADGSYGQFTFNTADSGTTLVTIKKAIATDNCTSTGWNVSTMGSGQAKFSDSGSNNLGVAMYLRSDYLTIDGQTRTSLNSGYGIKADGSVCNYVGEFCENIVVGDVGAVSNITIRYVEIQGSGATQLANNDHEDENLSIRNGSHIQFVYGYIHDSSGDPVELVSGSNNITIDNSYIYNNASSPPKGCNSPCVSGNHGEGIAANGSVSNLTVSNTVMQDIEGTAFIDCLNSGAAQSCNNWTIYNDVFFYTSGNPAGHGGLGDGIVGCVGNGVSGVSCANWQFYNNTIANCCNGSAEHLGVWWEAAASGTPIIKNNLFWNNVTTVANYSSATEDYNSFIGPNDTGAGHGAHDVNISTTSPTPFVNWTSSPPNFNLVGENSNWNNRVSLGAPYDTDAAGNPFSTDRGAFQYVNGSSSTPNPPQNLQVVTVN